MKAHKVPATYYASWKIPVTKHSFYVFYKDKLYSEGQSKSYKDVDKITQEHSFFMEENFYYLDIENMPGLAYKLQNEIEEFLSNSPYSIKCEDYWIIIDMICGHYYHPFKLSYVKIIAHIYKAPALELFSTLDIIFSSKAYIFMPSPL